MSIAKVTGLTKIFKTRKPQDTGGFLSRVKGYINPEYTDKVALDGVSFKLGKGEIVGLLGPNGSGKSTITKILTGIMHPTSGRAEVLGYVPWTDRYRYTYNIGVVFGQRELLEWELPALDSFRLYADIYEMDKDEFEANQEKFIKMFGMEDICKRPVRTLSLGERMKCELVAALIHKPKVIFLDEPTIGLDIVAKCKIRDFLSDLVREEKATILLTTHDISDIEHLCSRAIIIDKGRKIYDDKLEELTNNEGTKTNGDADTDARLETVIKNIYEGGK